MSGETGSASIVGVVAVTAILAAGLMAVEASTLVGDRLGAQTAADAAALAAAQATFPLGGSGDPREMAARFALHNGAELVSCECRIDHSWRPRVVRVVVRRLRSTLWFGTIAVTAGASAEFDPIGAIDP